MIWIECILLGFIVAVIIGIRGLFKQFSILREEFRLTGDGYQRRFSHQDEILASITTQRELFKFSLDAITRNLLLIQRELFELKMQADRREKSGISKVKTTDKKDKRRKAKGRKISDEQKKAIAAAVKKKWDSYSAEEREARKAKMKGGRKKKASPKEKPSVDVIELPHSPVHSTT